MREPGEDDEGEYWQLTPPPQAHPLDTCNCAKPAECYGSRGWHFNAAGAVYERCVATVKRSDVKQAAAHGKGRRGGRA